MPLASQGRGRQPRRRPPKRAGGPKRYDALHFSQVGGALARIDATNCAPSTKRAIRFTALTASRQVEVRPLQLTTTAPRLLHPETDRAGKAPRRSFATARFSILDRASRAGFRQAGKRARPRAGRRGRFRPRVRAREGLRVPALGLEFRCFQVALVVLAASTHGLSTSGRMPRGDERGIPAWSPRTEVERGKRARSGTNDQPATTRASASP